MNNKYKLTLVACFAGIFNQAVNVNLTAVLFVPLMHEYNLEYIHLGILTAVNFFAQFLSDIVFTGIAEKAGYRRTVIPACIISFFGTLLFASSPLIFSGNEFIGFCLSTVLFSAASGLMEVTLDPICGAVSDGKKGAVMNLLHSFGAWGQLASIIITSITLMIFGTGKWYIVVLAWSILPLICLLLFLKCEMPPENNDNLTGKNIGKALFNPLFSVLLFMMFFACATEVCMNQWASTFFCCALGTDKLVSDIFGMGGFALMMGIGRILCGISKKEILTEKLLILSFAVSSICYIVTALSPSRILSIISCALCGFCCSVAVPGIIALALEIYPNAGVWMFGILAAFTDVGSGAGAYLTGLLSEAFYQTKAELFVSRIYGISGNASALRISLLLCSLFPCIGILFANWIRVKLKKRKNSYIN